jgi:hypothetical protein
MKTMNAVEDNLKNLNRVTEDNCKTIDVKFFFITSEINSLQ